VPQATWRDPIVAGDVVYVPPESSILATALDGCGAPTRAPLSTIDLGSSANGGAIVDNGRLLVMGRFKVPASSA
jgi:hypothetical protein